MSCADKRGKRGGGGRCGHRGLVGWLVGCKTRFKALRRGCEVRGGGDREKTLCVETLFASDYSPYLPHHHHIF